MGYFQKISTKEISPSQNYLKEDTIYYILKCIEENKEEKLPPPPIVRKNPQRANSFIAIDGHNLLAVFDMLKKPCTVFVVENKEDKLKNSSNNPAIEKRNQELKEKFEHCVKENERVRKEGITSFIDLRRKYKILEK